MLVCINNTIINTDKIIAAEIGGGPYSFGVKVYLETTSSLLEIFIPTNTSNKEDAIAILEELTKKG